MYRLLNSMSFTSYTIFMVLLIFLLIYSIFDLNKKKPGHPYKYVLYCSIPTMISIFFYRYANEFTLSLFWTKFIDIVSTVLIIISFVVLGYSTYLADKKGFVSPKGKKLLKSTLIPCAIVFILCVLGIILIELFWE